MTTSTDLNLDAIKASADALKALSVEAHQTIGDLKNVVESMPEHFKLTECGQYALMVNLHGLNLLFRSEISLKESNGEGTIQCYLIPPAEQREQRALPLGKGIKFLTLDDLSTCGAVLDNKRKKFAQGILKELSEALAQQESLKLE